MPQNEGDYLDVYLQCLELRKKINCYEKNLTDTEQCLNYLRKIFASFKNSEKIVTATYQYLLKNNYELAYNFLISEWRKNKKFRYYAFNNIIKYPHLIQKIIIEHNDFTSKFLSKEKEKIYNLHSVYLKSNCKNYLQLFRLCQEFYEFIDEETKEHLITKIIVNQKEHLANYILTFHWEITLSQTQRLEALLVACKLNKSNR